MKKVTLMFAFIGMIMLQSCTVNDTTPVTTVDNDTIAEVFRFHNVSFLPNNYSITINFPHQIYSSDMVLLYRLSGYDNGQEIWKLAPETYYFNDGTLDFGYDFDFTKSNIYIRLIGSDLASLPSNLRLYQEFRVVVIPAYFANKSKNSVDFENYNAVIKAYKIDDTKN
jgi:hypothetical protein